MEGVSFGRIKYLIGTEIETVIKGYSCDSCDYCLICDNCPVCRDCQNYHYFCDACDEDTRNRIIEIAIDRGYITEAEAENIDDDRICKICLDFQLYNNIICQNCDPCTDCTYVRNPEYCPLDDEYFLDDIDIGRINRYLDTYYYDCSCGYEFTTKPFSSLRDYWQAVKAIVETVGKENIDIADKCGGHINISWKNDKKSWADYKLTIARNMLYFADLLSYMFCSPETYYRDEYKVYPKRFEHIGVDVEDKYCCVHIKDYAIEIRIPDSPKDVDNHVLFSATLLAISLRTTDIPFSIYDFEKTKKIYNEINHYGDELSHNDKRYLRDKFKVLMKFIEKPLKALSHDLGINLIKALEFRFKNPKYEEKEEKDFNLKQFAIKPKHAYVLNNIPNYITKTFLQLPLTAYT